MGSIVVDVMLKPEILDPQGQAVGGALPRLGFEGFTEVRQGKRFVLTVDGDVTDEHLAAAREAAEKLLSNPVIEDVVSVHVLEGTDAAGKAGDEVKGTKDKAAAGKGGRGKGAASEGVASEGESR
jgi:phosphoribosylformylglycinamidine synthase